MIRCYNVNTQTASANAKEIPPDKAEVKAEQTELIALHHLDVPWRPADMVQREGRILRQGNQNKNVMIFREGVI